MLLYTTRIVRALALRGVDALPRFTVPVPKKLALRAAGSGVFAPLVDWTWMLFDRGWYLYRHDGLGQQPDPVLHYLRWGQAQGRSPNPYFDPRWYRFQYRGDRRAVADPLRHYVLVGAKAGTNPSPLFHGRWYAEKYLGDDKKTNPLIHFLTDGLYRGYVGHPAWNEEAYLLANPDVARAVRERSIRSGYEHFARSGVAEVRGGFRRLPFVLDGKTIELDPNAYVEDNVNAQTKIASGECADGISHFFAYGWEPISRGWQRIYSRSRYVTCRADIAGAAAPLRRGYLCLFAHYDPDNIIDDYVVEYVRSLHGLGMDVVFVTAADSKHELARIDPYVVKKLIKNDAGRDFGSWFLAITRLELTSKREYDHVIWANDSIYYPVSDPKYMFERMKERSFNMWGITDSRETGIYHLQSFFLCFDRRAQEVVFPYFIERYRHNAYIGKWGQIREYEFGLTTYALDNGLSVGAFCAVEDIREDVVRDPALFRWRSRVQLGLHDINPTHDLWDLIVRHYSCPALKLELLRDNPRKMANARSYAGFIDGRFLDPDIVRRHLKRIRTGVMPPDHLRDTKSAVVKENQLVAKDLVDGHGQKRARRLVLMAHFDPADIIDDHVIKQLGSLNDNGCDVILITETENRGEIERVRDLVRQSIVKPPMGRDFGAWVLALKCVRPTIAEYETVIWMNDSSYFPVVDPAGMFRKMEAANLDLWGVVDSYSVRWHVMSWFWAFGSRIIKSDWFDWLLREYNPSHAKWEIIRNYEMRLPHLLRTNGYSVDAYIRAKDVQTYVLEKEPNHPARALAVGGDFTMTHDFWDLIIEKFGCPALKVELLRDNPLGKDLSRVFSLVGRVGNYDTRLIENHLRRLNSIAVP